MCTEGYNNKEISPEMTFGVLNLIPKANKDSRLLKNLRPITLLNTDYKIIEKSISNRLKEALQLIINEDQTGFMPGRRISTNIRKVIDLIKYTEINGENDEYVILNCDFLKCFDMVEFTCIEGAMRHFNFAEYLIDWVKILYSNFKIEIQNNGYFSEKIDVSRSIHQGGCCSAELFLICAEILAILLRENDDIEGIIVNKIINLLIQFADDLDVAMKLTEKGLKAVISVFEHFRHISGFTLNYDKTCLYCLSSMAIAKEYTLCPFKWTDKPTNILGVMVSPDDDLIIDLNYEGIKSKIKTIFEDWSKRNLSLLGKINVVNTLIGSLFIYKFAVLPTLPDKWVKMFESMINNFLWNGKRAKISLCVLQKPTALGGLNLVNLREQEHAIKISWIKILHENDSSSNLAYFFLSNTLKSDIWHCNISERDVDLLIKSKNKFCKDVLRTWASINCNKNDFLNQPIWWNSKIRIEKKPVLWKKLYEKGLMWVCQIYDGESFIDFQELSETYGISYLQYESLKSAIKSCSVDVIPQSPNTLSFYEQMLLTKKKFSEGISFTE